MDQLSLDLEQANKDLIESNIKTNTFAENTNALAMSLAMSPRNEISDLSHTLLCLADQDFEEYVLALRTLRAVSKSFSIISKVKPMDHIGEKVEIPFEKTEQVKVKREYKRRSQINSETNKTKTINLIKEFLKDGPNSGFNCINHVIEKLYNGIYKQTTCTTIHINVASIVNKDRGIWSLK